MSRSKARTRAVCVASRASSGLPSAWTISGVTEFGDPYVAGLLEEEKHETAAFRRVRRLPDAIVDLRGRTDADGRVRTVHADNGQAVEFGTLLFELEPIVAPPVV